MRPRSCWTPARACARRRRRRGRAGRGRAARPGSPPARLASATRPEPSSRPGARSPPREAKAIAHIGLVLLAVAAVALLFPRAFVVPVALALAWIGVSLLARAWRLRRA